MQYAERLPTAKTLLTPVLALAIGAAAATGAYGVLDKETVVVGEPEVIVAEVPAPGTVAKTKNEAAIAAGIAAGAASDTSGIKNEAAIAAGISAGAAEDAAAREDSLTAPGPRTD